MLKRHEGYPSFARRRCRAVQLVNNSCSVFNFSCCHRSHLHKCLTYRVKWSLQKREGKYTLLWLLTLWSVWLKFSMADSITRHQLFICTYTVLILWPSPHLSVFKRKRSCFAPDTDTAIVRTTTPKTNTENGAIRKRSPEWSDLKTMLFENAVF